MEKRIQRFWEIRFNDLKQALEGNNFEVFLADDGEEAKKSYWKTSFPIRMPKAFRGAAQ